ncbi:MAG: helix-turn-helix domain-containing protein [Halieaceae bacterium]|jgi:DNA-binding IclR family transcriptional regulator|nr:helix-turn-helix domain-containing protein [Halieaceae bacterium]
MALFSQPTARALAILDLLMANPHQAFGLTEMTRRLNLNKATCHAILTTMATYGFLVQHPKTKAYRLGPSIIAAGNAAFVQFPVLEYARPALESLEQDLDVGFAVTGRSKSHIVLLALYGKASHLIDNFQLGLRLPNIAPIGACFTAWSPAKHLQAWLDTAHEAYGGYDEKLDKRLRMSVIGIRARGYEVVLKTRAEAALHENLKQIQENWNLADLEEVTANYQRALCDEQVHLDRIEPRSRYEVATINVPVFAQRQLPALCFAAGSFEKPVTGAEIEHIAERIRAAANEVAEVAKQHAPQEDDH